MFSSLRTYARKAAAAAPSAGSKLRSSSAGGAISSGSSIEQTACRAFATVPGPRLFDYETVTSVLKQSDAVEAVEAAFGMLAKGKVDVPIPMHIGIDESEKAGPGDCHIKGGYISGTTTWTVKLANVSFYKNLEKVRLAGRVVCHLYAVYNLVCRGVLPSRSSGDTRMQHAFGTFGRRLSAAELGRVRHSHARSLPSRRSRRTPSIAFSPCVQCDRSVSGGINISPVFLAQQY